MFNRTKTRNVHSRMSANSRADFIMQSYGHLFGTVLALVGLEYYFFHNAKMVEFAKTMMGNWLLVLGAYMIVSMIASSMAHRIQSKPGQYFALGLYTLAEAIILFPLLYIAYLKVGTDEIFNATMITLSGFLALTAVAFITRKNFSFLRGILIFGGIIALGLIIASFIFPSLSLGIWFSVAMVGLAGGFILYSTSNIIHEYPEDRYVAASIELLGALTLLFWYVLRIVIALSED